MTSLIYARNTVALEKAVFAAIRDRRSVELDAALVPCDLRHITRREFLLLFS